MSEGGIHVDPFLGPCKPNPIMFYGGLFLGRAGAIARTVQCYHAYEISSTNILVVVMNQFVKIVSIDSDDLKAVCYRS